MSGGYNTIVPNYLPTRPSIFMDELNKLYIMEFNAFEGAYSEAIDDTNIP